MYQSGVNINEILRRLPAAHATLLLLSAGGVDDVEISRELDVPPESVAPMRELARLKLERIIGPNQ